MNIVTAQRTYLTPKNAEKQLEKVCKRMGITLDAVRYLIAVSPIEEGRFVPVVMMDDRHPERTLPFAHSGIMVVR